MSSRKCHLFATPLGMPCRTHGAGEDFRLLIPCHIHAGTKAVQDRQVEVVCNAEEAAELALALLNNLPVFWFAAHPEVVKKIAVILKVLQIKES